MIELENLNDELKEHLIFDEEYKYHYINYPYYQFRLFFISSFTIDEINELFVKQKTYIDLLKEYDNKIKFKVSENIEGGFTITHNKFIEIYDIEKYTIDEIKELFEVHKKQIDWFKNINSELLNRIYKNEKGKLSILHKYFELEDVLEYSYQEINEKFSSQIENQNKWIENKEYEKYLLSLPKSYRLYVFRENTEFPQKGNINLMKGKDKWRLDDKKYWELLRFLWLENSEKIRTSSFEWYRLFSCNRENKEFFMNEEEREYFNKLPNEFVVYRGFVDRISTIKKVSLSPDINWDLLKRNTLCSIGFSYTLSKEVGYKYVEKYKKYNKENKIENFIIQSDLFETIVTKEEVFGFINEKKEQEILIFKSGKYSRIGF